MQARHLLVGLVTVIASVTLGGQAQAQNIYVDYYTPQFYVDRLVFYDEAGTPIYYDGDTAYTVPTSYEFYNDLVNNFQNNPDAYYRWFQEVGYANLTYQRPLATSYYKPLYYLDYPVYYTDSGEPIYYIDGTMHHVPHTYGQYAALRAYYRGRRAAYLRWYAGPGRYYRWWRRPVYTGYYRPMYYDGYVVYYDGTGRPYYYQGDEMVFVPPTHRLYNSYVSHYRRHRAPYTRWYQERGRHNHGYRRPVYYRRRVVNRHAPRAVRGRAPVRVYSRRVGPRGRPGPDRPRHVGRPGPDRPHMGRPGPGPRHVGRPGPGPDRPGRVEHRPGPDRPGWGRRPGRVEPRPGPDRPGRGGGGVDCRRQPGHPACRGGGGRPEPRGQPEHRPGRRPGPPPRGEGRPGRPPGRRHR